jgi:phosphohistidine swiveling domain-containing protein
MTEPPAPGQLIPTPDNFPVLWDNPEDATLLWVQDSHAPAPLAPLSFSVVSNVLHGFQTAFAHMGMPIQVKVANFNGYVYASFLPANAPPEIVTRTLGLVNRLAPGLIRLMTDGMSAHMTRQQMKFLEPILSRFDAYWEDDLLPEINQHFAYFESCDLRGLSQTQLRAHFTESLKRADKVGELHARAAFPATAVMSLFEELYCELFPEAHTLEALRLLQGFDSQTLAGNRQLWELSRLALTIPSVHQILATRPTAEVVFALEGVVGGQQFLKEFRAYLQQYGQHLNLFGQLTERSWLDEPAPAVACLQAYLTQPDVNPKVEQAHQIAERDKAIAEARIRLAGYPQPVIIRFEMLLKAAQAAAGIKEDNHWVIERLMYQMRRLALEFGRRLAESGTLADVEDVFYLKADELLSREELSELPTQAKIEQRKAEREHFSRINAPIRLGTMPHFVLDLNGPFSRTMKKTENATISSHPDHTNELLGFPGSRGVARGPARIILSLNDADKLQPGDVLVAPATMPPWTPLFGIVAAVVTDSGGALSHCAIVAREYGIPAVVGTGRATKTLQNGQMVEVDGDAGRVRIISPP